MWPTKWLPPCSVHCHGFYQTSSKLHVIHCFHKTLVQVLKWTKLISSAVLCEDPEGALIPTSLLKIENILYLPDPLENHQLPIKHSMSNHHIRPTANTFKWRFIWWMKGRFEWILDLHLHSLKNKKNHKISILKFEVEPLWQNFLDSGVCFKVMHPLSVLFFCYRGTIACCLI